MNNFSESKKKLRREILGLRRQMKEDEKLQKDKCIEKEFFKSNEYIDSQNIFIYISYESEINTKDIILRALNEGKNIFVPRINIKSKIMEAVKIDSLDNLIENKYGILEPDENKNAVNPDKLNLIVVPGVAFDLRGGRMGYGAGYYDKYFKIINNKNIYKLALAYDFQLIDEVPMNDDDEYIDKIITESKSIKK